MVWPDTAGHTTGPGVGQDPLERGLVAVEHRLGAEAPRTRSLIHCGYYALDHDGRKVDSIASGAAGHLMRGDIAPKRGRRRRTPPDGPGRPLRRVGTQDPERLTPAHDAIIPSSSEYDVALR